MSSNEIASTTKESILQLVAEATTGRGHHDGVRLVHLQEIKRLGRMSHGCIRVLFDAILLRLRSPDCEVRMAALELWHALFERSALFRKLGCSKLDVFLTCVVGKCRRTGQWELPGPPGAAKELRRQGLGLVQDWSARYGHVLPRLRLGYRYLKQSSGIVFPREDEDSVRREAVLPDDVREAQETFSAGEERWNIVIRELETGQSVVPRRTEASEREEEEEEEDDDDGEAWEDVDDDGPVVPLSDTYREASSESIPKIQRILSVCRNHVDRVGVREMVDRAVELNAALVAACATYERRVGESARNRMEQELRERMQDVENRMDIQEQEHTERDVSRAPKETNPMQQMRDPTAPRVKRNKSRNPTSVPSKATPSGVLEKLASIAPVVPASGFARVWDSDAPPVYAGSHSMEVSNHWGPVDVHQELPKDRLDALFLIDQSKVKYQAGGSVQMHTPIVPSRTNAEETRQKSDVPGSTQLSSVQRDVLDASGLEGRHAERKYNEDILRDASMGHLSALDDLPQRQQTEAASQPRRRNASKRTIPVHERLAKKLFIKRKKT